MVPYLFGSERLVCGEVESYPVGGDETALLVGLGRQHLPQRVVEHVRPGVVVHHALPPRLVNLYKEQSSVSISSIGK